ncbi:type III CRISPR-associated RAMP protein Csx7 [Dictyobacter aurantiacus]|uniref:CRISPR-associated RAMP protein n=1 Tax=Dictyobacter aurantiacus TaxID=1936993 RepID=A0A401ZQZ6_9CHLR|nr:CRISPR-associated RAMP protein Csx7 [Dictyobacter aurantiacus]GCE09295.1 CRISPR-associated RAMP protein [Dictyobacter aurantiacus]
MAEETSRRYTLSNRYIFTGRLVMQTAFHIGGGRLTLSGSDSPVILTPEGQPFIPGSSFKGSLRSTTEKIVPALPESAELSSCGLVELSDEEQLAAQQQQKWVCSSLRQREFAQRYRNAPNDKNIFTQARKELCHTCQLFGSPFSASLMSIQDLYLADMTWFDGLIQHRDGVAIDRDSEKARDRLKYDFDVVPATTSFSMNITLENASPKDLQLISIGLSEFVNGYGVIGGKRSRGLGACILEDFKVTCIDLASGDQKERSLRLKNHLLKILPEPLDGPTFVHDQIDTLFADNNAR